MELNVYSSEKFERGKWRYVLLSLVIILVLGVCVYYKNRTGFILMFMILGGYIYLCLINVKEITMKITEDGLVLGEKVIGWMNLKGYVIEINKETQEIKNIVLISEKNHSIHTISDSIDNIKGFVSELDTYIPMLSEYNQTTREKVGRMLKL